MLSFVALVVRRRVTVLMSVLAIGVFGLVGYRRLPLDLLPDINYPTLTVQTEFPDTAPAEVENLITRPIEETVGVLKGLRTLHSVSRPGVSEVALEFEWGSDMDLLLLEVREKLDRLVLPTEAESPIVLRFDPSLDPVLRVALVGGLELDELRRLADRRVKQELETLPGVAAARVKGGLEEEIRVDLDQERLAALQVSIEDVRRAVGGGNVNLPGGSLEDAESRFLIRTVNEYDSIEEIGGLVLRQDENGTIRLRDVAEVRRGARDREEITRVNGREAVELDLYKEGDANTVTTARAVRGKLAELAKELPAGTALDVLFDQSRFIERAVGEVRSAALLGGLLAILVLLAFLRDLRSTLIIALSIPLSLVAAFLLMYRLGVTLNIMSLGGLTLGVGMLVDNSIVVLESIFRKRQEGQGAVGAAVEGASEVGAAVTASTLTTVAVFLPIVFVEGIAGQLFGDMALTVTVSLLASLGVALTVAPMLSALGRERSAPGPAGAGRTDGSETRAGGAGSSRRNARGSGAGPGRIARAYDRVLRGALARRDRTLGVAGLCFLVALGSVRWLETELIPQIHEGEFYFEVKLPEGTPLAATDRVLRGMEEAAAREPEVERVYATVGSRLAAGGLSAHKRAEHLGQVNVVCKDRGDEAAEDALASRLRTRFAQIPDLEARLAKPAYFSLKTPIELALFGENLDLLREYSLDLQRRLAGVPGLVDLRSSLEEGNPEIRIVFDRRRLAALQLDLRELSETLRNRIQGVVATRFKDEDRQIDVRVRNREVDRATLEDVRNLVVPGPGGVAIRLGTLAEVRVDRGPAEIHRLHQQRAAVLTANLQGRSLGSAAAAVRGALAAMPPPAGVTAELSGQSREMEVSFASLRFALLLAVFLVYIVMAATFESLLHPFLVMFSVPLALIGVIVGLHLTGTRVDVIVLIGVVLLAGIVVNNAIVLIDRINRNRRQGMEKLPAVVQAAHARLRPILMTTLTTVLGLLPMAVARGEGAELRAPLAITVSSGLVLSTLLTLVVIPALYMTVPSRVRATNGGAR